MFQFELLTKRDWAFVAAVTLVAAFSSAGTPAIAAGKCDNPNGMTEQPACAKAAEGPDALRQFVTRTRAVYGLYYFDYARDDAPAVAAATPHVAAANKTR